MGIFQFKYLAITLDLHKLYLRYYLLGPSTVLFSLSAEVIFYSHKGINQKPVSKYQIGRKKNAVIINGTTYFSVDQNNLLLLVLVIFLVKRLK